MRILRIYPYFQTEFKYLEHYLTSELKHKNCETTFLTSNCINPHWKRFTKNVEEYDHSYYEKDGYVIHRIKCRLIGDKPMPSETGRIKKIMKDGDFDIIHFSGIAGFFTTTCLRIYLKMGKKAPIFINDHSNPAVMSTSIFGKMYYKWSALVFSRYKKYIDCIISPNEGSRDLLKKRYRLSEESQKIIPLGYDQNVFNYDASLKNTNDKLVLGFAGKLEPRKKIERLFNSIAEDDKDLYAIIIVGAVEGDEYTNKLKSIAQERELNVEFRPLIDTPEGLANFYNYIDVAVYPGSISITTVEANACGVPVLIFESMPGLHYRVENGRGHLFKRTEELSVLLKQFGEDKSEISNQAIANETLSYSWKTISNKYYDLYTDKIKSKH